MRDRVVIDMFCGIGNFTLPLARAGALAVGIEASAEAVAMAEQNAQTNAVHGTCAFFDEDLYGEGGAMGMAEESIPRDSGSGIDGRFLHFGRAPDALILDPPRSGAGPNLEGWVRQPSLSQLVYVSCNPVTFAEDAKRLEACGFSLTQVGVYDMFPGTAHVETVGHFVRNTA